MGWRLPTGSPEAIPGGPEAVVLLLDVSGSMASSDYPPNRLEAMKEAAVKFIDAKRQISPEDMVGVITFGSYEEICSPLVVVREGYHELVSATRAIETNGSTEIVDGLKEAGRALSTGWLPSSTANRRIIVLSDGGFYGQGNPVKVAASLKNEGIVVECVGIGEREALDEDTLREMASVYDGKVLYRWIGDKENLERHFIEMSSGLAIRKKE